MNYIIKLAIGFSLCFIFNSICQNKVKSLKDKIPVLQGTCVLRGSEKNMSAFNSGFLLEKIVSNGCLNSNTKSRKNEVTKVTSYSNILRAEFLVFANCCNSFLGEIEIRKDTLNLIYQGYGNYCFCNCCHNLTYFIKKGDNINHYIINGDVKNIYSTSDSLK